MNNNIVSFLRPVSNTRLKVQNWHPEGDESEEDKQN